MRFHTPHRDVTFEIPDGWWEFVVVNDLPFNHPHFYAYDRESFPEAEIISLAALEPPRRSPGVESFKKYKLVPVMLAFWSPEYSLAPIHAKRSDNPDYKYQVTSGFHRFYASVAVGYAMIPAIVSKG